MGRSTTSWRAARTSSGLTDGVIFRNRSMSTVQVFGCSASKVDGSTTSGAGLNVIRPDGSACGGPVKKRLSSNQKSATSSGTL